MNKRESSFRPLTEDCQVEHYVQALKDASARVRYVMITLTIASILIFVGYSNSRKNGWFDSRLELARAAAEAWKYDTTGLNTVLDGLQVEVHEIDVAQGVESEDQLPRKVYSMELNTNLKTTPKIENPVDSELMERAIQWAQRRRLTTRSAIEDVIRIMEEARTQNATVMRMPILGLAFDINDLGLFSGVSFVVLVIMLAFSLSRYHENLFLALWKVRQICKAEKRPGDRGSVANLVYHSLAMAQLFSKPPSLARSSGGAGRSLSKLILLVPLSIQCLIFWHDFSTMDIGQMFNDLSTAVSIGIQLSCIIIVAVFTLACLAYTRSSEMRWKCTFYKINPCLNGISQPSWLEWVSLIGPKKKYEEEYRKRYMEMHGAPKLPSEPESPQNSDHNEKTTEPVTPDGPQQP